MMLRLGIVVAVSILLAGCTAYWKFPPGKTKADFDLDHQNCFWTASNMTDCMASKGYQNISQDEFVRLNQQAESQNQKALKELRKPTDIVVYEVRTKEIFIGQSVVTSLPTHPLKSLVSSIEIKGIHTNLSCNGYAELTKIVPGGKGSLGRSELLCKDGRKVTGEFVYDSLRSGYGRGVDGQGRQYRFAFGDLNLDPDKLRSQFQETLEKEKRTRREKRI